MRILAIIPARSGSKRLPGKNTKYLINKPLISWTVEFAQSVPWFTAIHVSTDSQEIADICINSGVPVPQLRPAALATDEATTFDVVQDVLDERRKQGQSFDSVALLQPTTPVRFKQRWDDAYQLLNSGNYDAVVGVSPADTHPYLVFRNSEAGFLEPWVSRDITLTRSQDFPPAYAVNGSLYLIKVAALLKQKTFFPKKCGSVICSEPVENSDIDTLFDWRVAEMLITDWMTQ